MGAHCFLEPSSSYGVRKTGTGAVRKSSRCSAYRVLGVELCHRVPPPPEDTLESEPPGPQNETLFGRRVVADVIS